jgi:copper chaperone CopZ
MTPGQPDGHRLCAGEMSHRSALSLLFLLPLACTRVEGSSSAADGESAAAQPAAKVAVAPAETAEAEAPMECNNPTDKAECGKEYGGCNQWDEAAAEVLKRDVPESAVWQTVNVGGMTCGGCERRIIAKVAEIDGILAVEADAELGQVRFALAQGADELARTATEQIRSLGYKVQ